MFLLLVPSVIWALHMLLSTFISYVTLCHSWGHSATCCVWSRVKMRRARTFCNFISDDQDAVRISSIVNIKSKTLNELLWLWKTWEREEWGGGGGVANLPKLYSAFQWTAVAVLSYQLNEYMYFYNWGLCAPVNLLCACHTEQTWL